MKKITLFLLMAVALLAGCGRANEKKLCGIWSTEMTYEKEEVTAVFQFDKNGRFTMQMIPLQTQGIGCSVEGEWKMNVFGGLTLNYRFSTLQALTCGGYDQGEEDIYLKKVKRHLTDADGTVKVKFSKSGSLTLETSDWTETFDEIDEDDVKHLLDTMADQGKKAKSKGKGDMPTSGSIHQFDYLAESYLSADDLSGLTGKQLRLLRNAIYALHNYDFDSTDLQTYFRDFDGYTPLTKDVSLNKIESYNVNLIKKYE